VREALRQSPPSPPTLGPSFLSEVSSIEIQRHQKRVVAAPFVDPNFPAGDLHRAPVKKAASVLTFKLFDDDVLQGAPAPAAAYRRLRIESSGASAAIPAAIPRALGGLGEPTGSN
jgi:hypothetical protein